MHQNNHRGVSYVLFDSVAVSRWISLLDCITTPKGLKASMYSCQRRNSFLTCDSESIKLEGPCSARSLLCVISVCVVCWDGIVLDYHLVFSLIYVTPEKCFYWTLCFYFSFCWAIGHKNLPSIPVCGVCAFTTTNLPISCDAKEEPTGGLPATTDCTDWPPSGKVCLLLGAHRPSGRAGLDSLCIPLLQHSRKASCVGTLGDKPWPVSTDSLHNFLPIKE